MMGRPTFSGGTDLAVGFIAVICIWAVILLISGGVGALLFPYVINSWLAYAGIKSTIAWYHGFLLGLVPVIGQTSVPAAVITFVAMAIL